MKKYILASLLLACAFGCGTDSSDSGLSTLNLLSYGIPVTIMAPDSAKVETMDFKVTKDISVKGEDGYYVQIFASTASTNLVSEVKQQQLEEVRSSPYFASIVREEPDGFIYETRVDSSSQNFSFRYIQIKGDWEYIFRTGLIGTFTLEQVEQMYAAVKPKVD